jgi:hypothetical protein
VYWFRRRKSGAFVVNCDLINSKNSTLIKFRRFIVNVHIMSVVSKYYTVEELIVEHNLLIKLKNHSLPHACLI